MYEIRGVASQHLVNLEESGQQTRGVALTLAGLTQHGLRRDVPPPPMRKVTGGGGTQETGTPGGTVILIPTFQFCLFP